MVGPENSLADEEALNAYRIEVEHDGIELFEGRELGDVAEAVPLRVNGFLRYRHTVDAVGRANRQSRSPILEGRLCVAVLVKERRTYELVRVRQALVRVVYFLDCNQIKGKETIDTSYHALINLALKTLRKLT